MTKHRTTFNYTRKKDKEWDHVHVDFLYGTVRFYNVFVWIIKTLTFPPSLSPRFIHNTAFWRTTRNLETTLPRDLCERLTVLASSLRGDLLGHSDAVLAFETRVGQPVTQKLLVV